MSFKSLMTPLTIGDITIKNRVGMSALTRNRAPHTYPSDLMKEYYVQRALGGAGLIVTEGILVTRQGTEWQHAPGIWNAEQVTGWKKIVDAVHEVGGKIFAQLWHVGRVAHPDAPEQKLAGVPVYAPSAVSARGGKFRFLPGVPGYVTPTAVENPWTIVEQFKQAAINAKEAGFDGVEIHGANGYLVTQFLDNTANHRTDEWGGSAENRSRFGLEILKAIKPIFGRNIAIKLSPAGGYNDVGMPLPDTVETYKYFITEAEKLDLAYIVLVRYGRGFDPEFDGKLRAIQHDVLETFRPFVKNTKLFINSEVTVEEGEQLVAAGKVDGIFIGFNWITHPDLLKRVLHGKALNNIPDIPHLQTKSEAGDWSVGYTNYPTAVY